MPHRFEVKKKVLNRISFKKETVGLYGSILEQQQGVKMSSVHLTF